MGKDALAVRFALYEGKQSFIIIITQGMDRNINILDNSPIV